jgi:hypothetical protein
MMRQFDEAAGRAAPSTAVGLQRSGGYVSVRSAHQVHCGLDLLKSSSSHVVLNGGRYRPEFERFQRRERCEHGL